MQLQRNWELARGRKRLCESECREKRINEIRVFHFYLYVFDRVTLRLVGHESYYKW